MAKKSGLTGFRSADLVGPWPQAGLVTKRSDGPALKGSPSMLGSVGPRRRRSCLCEQQRTSILAQPGPRPGCRWPRAVPAHPLVTAGGSPP